MLETRGNCKPCLLQEPQNASLFKCDGSKPSFGLPQLPEAGFQQTSPFWAGLPASARKASFSDVELSRCCYVLVSGVCHFSTTTACFLVVLSRFFRLMLQVFPASTTRMFTNDACVSMLSYCPSALWDAVDHEKLQQFEPVPFLRRRRRLSSEGPPPRLLLRPLRAHRPLRRRRRPQLLLPLLLLLLLLFILLRLLLLLLLLLVLLLLQQQLLLLPPEALLCCPCHILVRLMFWD